MYAERIAGLKSSAIRDILKLISKPGMISLAGGLPAPELFPLEALSAASRQVLTKYGAQALQYTITEGILPLREKIVKQLNATGTDLESENVMITQGSQQALELLAKLFLDKGSLVLTENPSYLGAIQAFRLFQADISAVESDDQGIRTDALRAALKKRKPAFLYLMPNFQNPTGVSLSLERRREIAAIAKEYQLLVIEDDPYGELIFEGEKLSSLLSLAGPDNVVYLSSFSKTIAPGLRVAFAVSNREIISKMTLVKQGTDLQTNTLGQYIVNEYLENGGYIRHIELIRRTYALRRDHMVAAMKKHFPESASWNQPHGGMFLWVKLREGSNAKNVLLRCIERNVAFVPGEEFFPDGDGGNTARLNFSNSSIENIDEAIRRMGEVLRELY